MHKATGEGWNPYALDILVLSTLLCVLKTPDEFCYLYRLVLLVLNSLFCIHKTTDDSWNPYRLVILVQFTLFACNNHRWGLGTIETGYSVANHAVLHAQNDRLGLVPIETCMLVQKSLFCMQKPQVRAGTHRDQLFWCYARCFACTKRQVRPGTNRDL